MHILAKKEAVLLTEHQRMMANAEKTRIRDLNEQRLMDGHALRELQEQEFNQQKVKASEHDQQMARALKADKEAQLKEQKLRQQVRENSCELRELKQKLDAALIQKEQVAQMLAKRALLFDKTLEEVEHARQVMAAQEESERVRLELDKMKHSNQERVKQDMEEQLQLKREQREKQLEEKVVDKRLIEEELRKIYAEDAKHREKEQETRKQLQAQMVKTWQEREEARRREEELIQEEQQRVQKYLAEKELEAARRQQEKKQAQDAMDEYQMRLGVEMLQQEQRRKEREQLYQAKEQEEQLERGKRKIKLRDETLSLIEMRKESVLRQIEKNRQANEESRLREQRLARIIEEEKNRLRLEYQAANST
ncbi:mannosyl-oligosaccharide alpha-1,2-mannosidase [Cichlidogyrus casuarinus]|uniref:Meiosis-specific nuclear structural protein 1 n=1 Tax=Cichlidogyrus casuarinus TaxID=1844966 RepID=A0ABD2Q4L1_9PLAT